MSYPHQSPMDHRDPELPADALDQLIRAFYRAEMPDPWPALKLPTATASAPAPPRERVHPWLSGRMALAASVVLLLCGTWYLAGLFPGYPTARPGSPSEGAASRHRIEEYRIEYRLGPDGKPLEPPTTRVIVSDPGK